VVSSLFIGMWRLGAGHWIRKVPPNQGPISWQSVIKTFHFLLTETASMDA
jgi:hypothetical protein